MKLLFSPFLAKINKHHSETCIALLEEKSANFFIQFNQSLREHASARVVLNDSKKNKN
jgi:hypothetical protein